MGKYSDFERKERDYYPTPRAGVVPLLKHLPPSFTYAEPCAGNGALVQHLDYLTESRCVATWLSDIEPQDESFDKIDALDVIVPSNTDYIITNPPWDRKILHPMIEHFASQKPTWLLFQANWMFTKQAQPYLKYCNKIVTVGRLVWIPGTKQTGKEDCCWYLFDKKFIGRTRFFGKEG